MPLTRLSALTLVLAVLAAPAAWGTVFTFTGMPIQVFLDPSAEQPGVDTSNTWGSYALGDSLGIASGNTPNVLVQWGFSDNNPGGVTNHWLTDGAIAWWTPNDVGQPFWPSVPDPITFSSNAGGIFVQLRSMDIVGYGVTNRAIVGISVDGGPITTIFDSGVVDAFNTVHVDLTAGGTIQPSSTTALYLEIWGYVYNGPFAQQGNLLNIDNLEFTQTPEPGSILLMLAGGALLFLRYRRR